MKQVEITTTYGEYEEFARVAKGYINQKDLRPSHLTLAITKTIKENKHHLEDLNDLIAEKRIDLAQKDKDGTIVVNQNGTYKMKADASKKLQTALRKIKNTKIKVGVFIAKEIPKSLELPWYEYFVPFVIKDYPEPEPEPAQSEAAE